MSKRNKVATLQRQADEALKRGALPQAKELLEQICRLDKGNAQSWFLLGAVLGSLGKGEGAVKASRKAVELQPGNPDAHFNLGHALVATGRPAEAERPLRRSLSLAPRHPRALLLLGDLLDELERHAEANEYFRKAGELDPKLAYARSDLAKALIDNGQADKAFAAYRRALTMAPGNTEILYMYASMLANQGHLDEAEEALRGAPDHPYISAARANLFAKRGEYDEAKAALLPALEHPEKLTGVALAFSRICRRIDACAEAIDYINAVLTTPQGSGDRAISLRFTLAKLYDQQGDYDQAFANALTANRQKAKSVGSYNPAAFERIVDQLIEVTQPERLADIPCAANTSELPVFIIGMPRSGTSLTEQILASHPLAHGAGELNDIETAAQSLGQLYPAAGYPRCLGSVTPTQIGQAANAHLAKLSSMAGEAIRVTDKMPPNFFHAALISRLFPGARIIHTRRNPLDTALSIFFQNFSAHYAYGYELSHLGHYYRQYLRIMAHWRSALPHPMLEVDYEALVTEGEPLFRKMIDFIGLEWNDACLNFHTSKRMVHTASWDQVRQPLHSRSVEKWRNYESHLGPLIEALGDAI